MATVEFLGRHEVLQVLVVHLDFYQVLGSFHKVPPFFQHANDSEHLLVMDFVVLFHRRQGVAIESHWVPFFFSR